MAEQISMAEVRKTIATSLGAAFGFIIALLWNSVVVGALATADIQLGATAVINDWGKWAYGVVSAVVLTVVMVVLIVVVGRWGGK
jgi:glycerol uptake facilitator-like aquaporin